MVIPRVRPLPVTGYTNLNALGHTRAAILEGAAPERFEQGIAELASWRAQPGAALWFAMCLAEGERPR